MTTDRSRFLVLGATGTTGSRVRDRLRAEGRDVVGASRSTTPSFDWHDPRTHDAVLRGVTAVYVVAPVGELEIEPVMMPFVERALDAGVRRFVMLSAAIAPPGSPGLGAVHSRIAAVAPEFSAVRPSWFMQNFVEPDHWLAQDIDAHDRIRTSVGDARIAFVDADDIAAVAVRALSDADSPGEDLIVTGPEPLSYDDVARTISHAAGRTIAHERVSTEAVRDGIVAAGLDPGFAAMHASLDALIVGGAENRVTDTVRRVTGREPRSFDEFARAHADRWSPAGRLRAREGTVEAPR